MLATRTQTHDTTANTPTGMAGAEDYRVVLVNAQGLEPTTVEINPSKDAVSLFTWALQHRRQLPKRTLTSLRGHVLGLQAHAVPYLIEELGQELDPFAATELESALTELAPEAVGVLLGALKAGETPVNARIDLARVLMNLDTHANPEIVATVLEVLERPHDDLYVREGCVAALEEHLTPDLIHRLHAVIKTEPDPLLVEAIHDMLERHAGDGPS